MKTTHSESSIGIRFKELISFLGKTNNSFAISIGKTSTTINNIVEGKSEPGYKLLEAIFKVYPQINPDWLINGNGEIIRSRQNQDATKPDAYLMEILSKFESFFKSQLEAKDRQIEFLMGQLGKFDGVTEETQTRSLWPEHWAEA